MSATVGRRQKDENILFLLPFDFGFYACTDPPVVRGTAVKNLAAVRRGIFLKSGLRLAPGTAVRWLVGMLGSDTDWPP
jgi:hypothetical protein